MSDKNVIDVNEPEIVPSDEGTEQADHNAPNSMPSYEAEVIFVLLISFPPPPQELLTISM